MRGLSLMEVLITIAIVGVFSGSFLVVLGNSTRAGSMFCERVQGLNSARARIAELMATSETSLIANFITGTTEVRDRDYSYLRRTLVSEDASRFSITVEVTNGSGEMDPSGNGLMKSDGTMGANIYEFTYRVKGM
ncbi:MAG: type II secretion system protein [Candidatus Wallbacteria bacterium]|nr:type II secretion system protein [Candidatus Wallbacteria bacterium]